MTNVQEIESAVSKLTREELISFRNWFDEFYAEAWDEQLEEDIASGRFDHLADEALKDMKEGRCSEL